MSRVTKKTSYRKETREEDDYVDGEKVHPTYRSTREENYEDDDESRQKR